MNKPNIDDVIKIALYAGRRIMVHAHPDVEISYKDDDSPCTQADIAAHIHICRGLERLTPDIPVLSEEHDDYLKQEALKSDTYWLTDPLDGTRTFVGYAKGNKDHNVFGVHIALIHKGEPVMGVVYLPAQETLYYTGNDGHAYKQIIGQKKATRIHANSPEDLAARDALTLTVSYRTKSQESPIKTDRPIKFIPYGGGNRFTLVAEGKADAGWMNMIAAAWDLGAVHAILRSAGGDLIDAVTRKPVRYTKDLAIPPVLGAHTRTLDLFKHAGPAKAGLNSNKKRRGNRPSPQ